MYLLRAASSQAGHWTAAQEAKEKINLLLETEKGQKPDVGGGVLRTCLGGSLRLHYLLLLPGPLAVPCHTE